MLVKLLMSLSEKYDLEGSTISVGLHEVKAKEKPRLRAIDPYRCDHLKLMAL